MTIDLPEQEEPAFQMAPMIDMVFLLLVFFMCASQLSQKQNIPMEIPTASQAVVPKERPNRWVVNLTAKGDLYSGDTSTDLDTLAEQVKARLAAVPGLQVYIRADQACEHRHVKKVMSRLAEVGMDDFIFGTYIPTSKAEVVPQ
jgi:biopolymer transport protein ExbD